MISFRRTRALTASAGAVAVLLAGSLGAPPTQAQEGQPVTVVRQPAAPDQRPGPDALYAPAPAAPQLENAGVWAAQPLMVSGASAYRDGEFLYQDYVYDDLGTYPTDPQYTQNDADLVEVRLKPLAEALAVRLTFQSMRTPEITGTTLSLGTSPALQEMPHGANARTKAEVFVTVHGADAEVVDAATGQPVEPSGVAVAVDVRRRQVDVRIPYDVYDPRGKADVQVGAASGLWDSAANAYAPQGAGLEAAFLNAAFRYSEQGDWFAGDQEASFTTGDLSAFAASIDFPRLAAGVDDDLTGTEEGVPSSGVLARLYPSRYELAQGRGVADVPTGGALGGGQPTPENCPDGCIVPYPNQLQPYTIYVPEAPPPATGYGLTVYLHGANGNYTTLSGANAVRQFADRGTGSIVLMPHERGETNTYYGLAEADTFEAWADVARSYPLDSSLTAVTGVSMGGVGSYKYASEYPDLFARAAPVIGYVYSWVGYTGPPDGQHTTAKGEYNVFYSALDGLRNVPLMIWNGGNDELVPYKAVRPIIDRLDALGFRYDHLLFGTEHFSTGAAADRDSQEIADFFGDARVEPNPAHVTYVKNSNFQEPRYGLNPDHAYWVSGISAREAATTLDEYGSAATFSSVDVLSHGFGVGDPEVLDTQRGAGVHSVAGAFSRETKTWAEAAPATPVDDRLDIRTRNVASITIDVARARVSCDPALAVDSDGPLTVVLAGCPAAAPTSGSPGTVTSGSPGPGGAGNDGRLAATGPAVPAAVAALLMVSAALLGRSRGCRGAARGGGSGSPGPETNPHRCPRPSGRGHR